MDCHYRLDSTFVNNLLSSITEIMSRTVSFVPIVELSEKWWNSTTSKQNFICRKCSQNFTERVALRTHKLVHLKAKQVSYNNRGKANSNLSFNDPFHHSESTDPARKSTLKNDSRREIPPSSASAIRKTDLSIPGRCQASTMKQIDIAVPHGNTNNTSAHNWSPKILQREQRIIKKSRKSKFPCKNINRECEEVQSRRKISIGEGQPRVRSNQGNQTTSSKLLEQEDEVSSDLILYLLPESSPTNACVENDKSDPTSETRDDFQNDSFELVLIAHEEVEFVDVDDLKECNQETVIIQIEKHANNEGRTESPELPSLELERVDSFDSFDSDTEFPIHASDIATVCGSDLDIGANETIGLDVADSHRPRPVKKMKNPSSIRKRRSAGDNMLLRSVLDKTLLIRLRKCDDHSEMPSNRQVRKEPFKLAEASSAEPPSNIIFPTQKDPVTSFEELPINHGPCNNTQSLKRKRSVSSKEEWSVVSNLHEDAQEPLKLKIKRRCISARNETEGIMFLDDNDKVRSFDPTPEVTNQNHSSRVPQIRFGQEMVSDECYRPEITSHIFQYADDQGTGPDVSKSCFNEVLHQAPRDGYISQIASPTPESYYDFPERSPWMSERSNSPDMTPRISDYCNSPYMTPHRLSDFYDSPAMTPQVSDDSSTPELTLQMPNTSQCFTLQMPAQISHNYSNTEMSVQNIQIPGDLGQKTAVQISDNYTSPDKPVCSSVVDSEMVPSIFDMDCQQMIPQVGKNRDRQEITPQFSDNSYRQEMPITAHDSHNQSPASPTSPDSPPVNEDDVGLKTTQVSQKSQTYEIATQVSEDKVKQEMVSRGFDNTEKLPRTLSITAETLMIPQVYGNNDGSEIVSQIYKNPDKFETIPQISKSSDSSQTVNDVSENSCTSMVSRQNSLNIDHDPSMTISENTINPAMIPQVPEKGVHGGKAILPSFHSPCEEPAQESPESPPTNLPENLENSSPGVRFFGPFFRDENLLVSNPNSQDKADNLTPTSRSSADSGIYESGRIDEPSFGTDKSTNITNFSNAINSNSGCQFPAYESRNSQSFEQYNSKVGWDTKQCTAFSNNEDPPEVNTRPSPELTTVVPSNLKKSHEENDWFEESLEELCKSLDSDPNKGHTNKSDSVIIVQQFGPNVGKIHYDHPPPNSMSDCESEPSVKTYTELVNKIQTVPVIPSITKINNALSFNESQNNDTLDDTFSEIQPSKNVECLQEDVVEIIPEVEHVVEIIPEVEHVIEIIPEVQRLEECAKSDELESKKVENTVEADKEPILTVSELEAEKIEQITIEEAPLELRITFKVPEDHQLWLPTLNRLQRLSKNKENQNPTSIDDKPESKLDNSTVKTVDPADESHIEIGKDVDIPVAAENTDSAAPSTEFSAETTLAATPPEIMEVIENPVRSQTSEPEQSIPMLNPLNETDIHRREFTTESHYECPLCLKKFENARHLRHHEKTHLNSHRRAYQMDSEFIDIDCPVLYEIERMDKIKPTPSRRSSESTYSKINIGSLCKKPSLQNGMAHQGYNEEDIENELASKYLTKLSNPENDSIRSSKIQSKSKAKHSEKRQLEEQRYLNTEIKITMPKLVKGCKTESFTSEASVKSFYTNGKRFFEGFCKICGLTCDFESSTTHYISKDKDQPFSCLTCEGKFGEDDWGHHNLGCSEEDEFVAGYRILRDPDGMLVHSEPILGLRKKRDFICCQCFIVLSGP